MRKILFALFAVMFVTSLCFAKQPAPSAATTTSKAVEAKIFMGKIESVTLGNAAKKIKSEIAVVNEKGEKLSLVVKSGIPITNEGGKTVMLSEVKKDSKVAIKYITNKSGIHKAQSIKLIE